MESKPIILSITASFATFFLYVILFPLKTYSVTIGSIFCALYVLYYAASIRKITISLYFGMFLLIYPIITYFISQSNAGPIVTSSEKFISSYALWAISIIIITLSFNQIRPLYPASSFSVALFILIIMSAQTLGKMFFGSTLAYEIVASLVGVDLSSSYLGIYKFDNVRAIGMYYEPSMCARVVGTLCIIDCIVNKKYIRNLIIFFCSAALTQSIGLIVMVAVIVPVLIVRSIKSTFLVLVIGTVISVLLMPLFYDRIANNSDLAGSSTHTRTVAPITTVDWVFNKSIMGIPIGGADELALVTGYARETGEKRITNGFYEFFTYFGITAIIVSFIFLFIITNNIIIGNRERAAALIYLCMSTALSGSFLSIESSLLTAFFVSAMLSAEYKRLKSSSI